MTYRPDEDIVLEWPKTDSPSAPDRSNDVPDPAEVERLRKRVNLLEVKWQGEQITRAELEDELQRQSDELERLRAERAGMGTLPFESAFLIHGEPEQLIFRGPHGQVVLRRVRDEEGSNG